MTDRSTETLRYEFELLASELTSRFNIDQQRILARFPAGYVRNVEDLVATRWPYLPYESRLKMASMIQLGDVNRWNLNVWDMGHGVRSIWEWYCSIPLISVMEALVVQYAKIKSWLETKNTFHDAINFLRRESVIDETLKGRLHSWRKFRNQIHLDPRNRMEANCTFNDAVLTLQSLEATLLWDWKRLVKPIVQFEDIWVNYDAAEDDYGTGLEIRCGFTIHNLLNERCRAVAFFYFESGEPLRDLNDEFTTAEGYASASTDFVPPYNDAAFTENAALRIYMPYSELHLENGEHHLKFYVGLYSNDLNCYFAFSPWEHFRITLPESGVALQD